MNKEQSNQDSLGTRNQGRGSLHLPGEGHSRWQTLKLLLLSGLRFLVSLLFNCGFQVQSRAARRFPSPPRRRPDQHFRLRQHDAFRLGHGKTGADLRLERGLRRLDPLRRQRNDFIHHRVAGRSRTATKLQAPTSKRQGSSNKQAPNRRTPFGSWSLEFWRFNSITTTSKFMRRSSPASWQRRPFDAKN